MRYRWSNPYQWLASKGYLDRVNRGIRNIILRTDFDTIQDEFQSEMDGDGYFTQYLTDDCELCDKPVAKDDGFVCCKCHKTFHDDCDDSTRTDDDQVMCSICKEEEDEYDQNLPTTN